MKKVLQEVKPSKQEPEFPLAYFEPVNDKCKPMYCKDKVYCGGTEFSLEELRAEAWKRKKPVKVATDSKDAKKSSVPVSKSIIVYETWRDGQEWSFEELRAQDYLAKLKKKFDYPIALFEPENPAQVRVCKSRLY
jgi:hypothetical protein